MEEGRQGKRRHLQKLLTEAIISYAVLYFSDSTWSETQCWNRRSAVGIRSRFYLLVMCTALDQINLRYDVLHPVVGQLFKASVTIVTF